MFDFEMKSKYLLVVVLLLIVLIAVVFFVGFKGVIFLKDRDSGYQNQSLPNIEKHSV